MNGGKTRDHRHPPSSGQHHRPGKRSRSFGISFHQPDAKYGRRDRKPAVTVERAGLDVERGRHSDQSIVPDRPQDLLLPQGSARSGLVAR
jgi:hypothetical protein